ncbi:Kelch repeat-containing protein [Streptomyces sp. 5.8]|uniref:Kelch repeat-containing protein n=1 Tax=Streptomyces sp. 5.8 TaxID=3406571 RepID=UPI003BB5871B
MRTFLAGGEPAVPGAFGPDARAAAGAWKAAGTFPFPLVKWAGQQEVPVRLPDGRVLAAGGASALLTALDGSALYDPADGSWAPTGPLRQARRLHSLTVLADGRVLAVGGIPGPQAYPPPALTTVELYDPATRTWTPTGGLNEARYGHSATLLSDGRVLVAGGERPRSPGTPGTLASAEVYDPVTAAWTRTGEMSDARWHHGAVALPDGRVLAVGGITTTGPVRAGSVGVCETYDPQSGTWTPAGTLRRARFAHQTVLLPDGTVLAVGGCDPWSADDARFDPYSLSSVERYDPVGGAWYPEPPLPWGRGYHRALLLDSGEVLVCGGADSACLDVGFASALRYDPLARVWSPAGPMRTGRWSFGAALLGDGRVLAVAGVTRSGVAAPALGADVPAVVAEVFTP